MGSGKKRIPESGVKKAPEDPDPQHCMEDNVAQVSLISDISSCANEKEEWPYLVIFKN
jgi:hypothetical protein